MLHRSILKVTKFQLSIPKRFGTVVRNIFGGGHDDMNKRFVDIDCWKMQKTNLMDSETTIRKVLSELVQSDYI